MSKSTASRLIEQGEHVLLVGLHTRLVEGVHAKQVTTDTAGNLKEVDHLSEVALVEAWHRDADVRNTTIDMSQTGAEFGHLVYFVNALASEEVQTVKVLLVAGEEQLLLRLLDADNGLEDGTLAILNPLSHGVEVGGEVNTGREDTLLVLTFGLTIELLPPF